MTYVRGAQETIFVSAEKMSRTSFRWSVIITTAMVLGLLFFQSAIRKMSSRLYNKNKQFELLSDTVDETFLFFGEGNKCDFVSFQSIKHTSNSQPSLCAEITRSTASFALSTHSA